VRFRYCIVRHCAFLVGRGHSSGDPGVEQAIKLLKTAPPWDRDPEAILRQLEGLPSLTEWPAAETEAEDWLIAAATLVFVEPRAHGTAASRAAQRARRQSLRAPHGVARLHSHSPLLDRAASRAGVSKLSSY